MKKLTTILLIAIGSCAYSQDPTLPDGRTNGLLIYDPASKGMLLFDGYQIHLDSTRNDVWKWDGKIWEKISANGPGTRSLSAGALNTQTGAATIFAGIGKENYNDKKSDTWIFKNKTWTKLPTNFIGTRDHHEMVYADHLKSFVMYGGLNEKREYDSTTWLLTESKFVPVSIPGPGMRYHFAMAYDRNRKIVVLYGGGKQERRDELWEFDGNSWKKIEQINNPGKRLRHSMVYDEALRMVLLHGADESGTTWGWDGKEWKKIASNGPVADLIALGYFPVTKTTLAFGGSGDGGTLNSDLWELKDGSWRKISDNGKWKWVDSKLQRVRN